VKSVEDAAKSKPDRKWELLVNHPTNGVRLLSAEEAEELAKENKG
jgi:hypothetical protein